MTDNFALLDEPRRPWIDPGELKTKFLALSAEGHPDRVHTADEEEKRAVHQLFTELNAAYNCLRETKARLRHLLELELGAKPKDVQRVPPDLMELFAAVGQLCGEVAAFEVEKNKITSPVLKVQMFERSQAWTEKLNALQQQIASRRDELAAELRVMNDAWQAASTGVDAPARRTVLPLERLEEIYSRSSYYDRWAKQIQERIVQLSF